MFPSSVRDLLPTYEYLCKKCGQNIEAYQKFSDAPLKKHEGCGGELRKVFHANGVVFKGSGFYSTDSRTSTSSTSAGNGAANGSSNGDGEKETSTKGDSKEKVSASKGTDSKSSDSKSSDSKSDPKH